MTKYKHLIAFDLSSYGVGLAIINKFVDGETIKDFEISPCGTNAQLILLSQDFMALQVVKNESLSFFKSQVLAVETIENFHPELLPCYLSQNKVSLLNKLMVLEGQSLPAGLVIMQGLLSKGAVAVDFRIVRTDRKNIIITVSLNDFDSVAGLEFFAFKKTMIESIEPSLKSFFQI